MPLCHPLLLTPPSRIKSKRSLVGRPGPRDLSENMAATQGLSHMISDCKKLFQVSHSRPWCLLPRPSRTIRPDLLHPKSGRGPILTHIPQPPASSSSPTRFLIYHTVVAKPFYSL